MSDRLWTIAALALSLSATTACGDDDGGGGDSAGTGGGGGAGSGAAGAGAGGTGGGGTGGAGGTASGGMGGSGGGGMGGSGGGSTPVTCGSAMCSGSSFLRACCVDAASSTCGVESTMLGLACGVPGVADARCPDRAAAMGFTLQGCCIPDNVCGGTLMGSPCIVIPEDGGTGVACDASDADGGI